MRKPRVCRQGPQHGDKRTTSRPVPPRRCFHRKRFDVGFVCDDVKHQATAWELELKELVVVIPCHTTKSCRPREQCTMTAHVQRQPPPCRLTVRHGTTILVSPGEQSMSSQTVSARTLARLGRSFRNTRRSAGGVSMPSGPGEHQPAFSSVLCIVLTASTKRSVAA